MSLKSNNILPPMLAPYDISFYSYLVYLFLIFYDFIFILVTF